MRKKIINSLIVFTLVLFLILIGGCVGGEVNSDSSDVSPVTDESVEVANTQVVDGTIEGSEEEAGPSESGPDGELDETDLEIISVIKDHIAALASEDIQATLDTMHEDAPEFSQMEPTLKSVFDTYDIEYELKYVRVLEKNENEAKVLFIQITKKLDGPDEPKIDNESTGVHTLRKSGDRWKIYYTEIQEVNYL